MKRIAAIVLCLLMVLSSVSCGVQESEEPTKSTPKTNKKPTTTVTTEPTEYPTTVPTTALTEAPTEPSWPTGPLVTYTDDYGNSVRVPEGTDVFDYTLYYAQLPAVASQFPLVEQLIFQQTNDQRAKEGLPALALEEKAYFFANKRAYEASVNWSHTRPNGEPYYHIFAEYGVMGENGENLYYVQSGNLSDSYISSQEGAKFLADKSITGWLNSPGHRENMMDERWNSVAIAVYYDVQVQKFFAVQLFFA